VDGFQSEEDSVLSRLRARLALRRELRSDRRARRRASMGNPGDAAAKARSENFQSGGYFTTRPSRKP
jgi:hypothetical protein